MKARAAGGSTRVLPFLLALALFLNAAGCRKAPAGAEAYNVPAEVKVRGEKLVIEYRGRTVFSGRIETQGGPFSVTTNVFRTGKAVTNIVSLTAAPGAGMLLRGEVTASAESFPCEADRRDAGPVIVRHVSGLSRSRLNRAVYDRGSDWVLSVDAGPRVLVGPERDDAERRTYGLEAAGREVVLRFKPAYYRVHRGLDRFEPWTYQVSREPVAGWISWFAFFDKVTEADIVETADTLSETLLPFGYEYLQIDDGYQRGEGLPELWLDANDKFPSGLGFLPGYIKGKGLKPGIWTNVAFKQADFASTHKDWFVTGPDGRPARGNWVEYSLDASNEDALNAVVRPVYRGLKEMGWEYFKVDALRHLRYEGYNAHAGHFGRKKADRAAAFRRYVEVVREEVGRSRFLLACWGVRPELVGLVDGCRLGTDGFSYAGLAQFNSWNNVVWRNDPDHIELNEERYRSLLVTSLTGSILLLTDKPAVYRTPAAEPAKRAAPVLWTVPGQVFDVDPSRSGQLDRVDAEVSGSGPRPFDAGLKPACDLWLLEVVRPFENWVALGRTGGSEEVIRFEDLGLEPDREYAVFEFWSKKAVGTFSGAFIPGPIDPVFRSQCFIIRERQERPQLLATGRHLTGGGQDLLDLKWDGGRLSGKSRLAGRDPYDIIVHMPQGWRLDRVEVEGAVHSGTSSDGPVLVVRLFSENAGQANWTLAFSR
jgi:hypothetical protein